MPSTLDALARDALVLPAEQRMELAYRLLSSVDLGTEPDAGQEWESEIARRIERFDAGEVRAIPVDEALARLRNIAPGV